MRTMWDYGQDDARMAQELIAEMTTPKALAERLQGKGITLEGAESFINKARGRYPAVDRFLERLPETIPETAYDIPVWNQRLLGTAGQGAEQGVSRWSQE